ncbi:MAG: proline--tRNA ligase [Waddliaceae bacterium]
MSKQKNAITPTREENYPEWYQQVIKAADLAENAPVRGCMVIKPWGFGIWENIQRQLDYRIKETGHENAYFPLFIPLSFLEKEAQHVEGFAKECAVVTHHRLEQSGGKLIPAGELEEPLIVRPTSETIIGDSFSRWISSYRDLPMKINQWANVVRWEMRPRLFLRTSEFLWQEGHTVHATAEEAIEETLMILELYRSFMEDVLAIPVIVGEKSPAERFPGADSTYTMEAMMQDGKALQMGTSHYLGQNFSKASNIQFSTQEGGLEYGFSTSWGVTTRMIGAMIMVHSDDDGLRLPPRVAHKHVVIIPVIPKEEMRESVLGYAEAIAASLRKLTYHGQPLVVLIDSRDRRGKSWEWVKKGIPLRIEVGPRDVDANCAMLSRRNFPSTEKEKVNVESLPVIVPQILDEMQEYYYAEALKYRDARLNTELTTLDQLANYFSNEQNPGFARVKWSEDRESEAYLDKYKLTIRCIPNEQSGTEGLCILTGKPAKTDVIIARAY